MVPYRRLSLMEREELSRMLAAGHSLRATAQALSRAPSTLSRELARLGTSPVTYRAVAADQRAQRWAHHPRKPRKLAIQHHLCTAVRSRDHQECSRAGVSGQRFGDAGCQCSCAIDQGRIDAGLSVRAYTCRTEVENFNIGSISGHRRRPCQAPAVERAGPISVIATNRAC